MSKLFTTGTIAQPDAGSVGLAMVEQIRDDLTAHVAWELVEEFTPGGGSVCWYVFKNLATESGLADDWYAVIGRTLASGKLSLAICEDYDSATHTMGFFSPVPDGGMYTFDSLGRRTETVVLSTGELGSLSPAPGSLTWTPTGVSTKWWLIAAEDGFTAAFNGASNGWFSAAAYVPLAEDPIDLPIIVFGSSGNWGICRNPAVATVTQRGYSLMVDPAQWALGFYGRFDVDDKLQGNRRLVSELAVRMNANYSGASVDPAIWGQALGKYKNLRFGTPGSYPVTLSFGDAFVLNGTLWVPYNVGDSRIWDTGVAV
jgi:hypothetical protein